MQISGMGQGWTINYRRDRFCNESTKMSFIFGALFLVLGGISSTLEVKVGKVPLSKESTVFIVTGIFFIVLALIHGCRRSLALRANE